MVRPLYIEATREPRNFNKGGNAGLWFDKFCHSWHVSGTDWSMPSPGNADDEGGKLRWIKSVTSSPVGSEPQLSEFAERVAKLSQQLGGKTAVFTTVSSFVTGLGRSHPVENGFAWHPTLGVPFITGSSIKGMVRAWAVIDSEPRPDAATIERILGSAHYGGRVAFLDAVPIKPVNLEADIMTPHYAGWTAENPPGDWHDPTPIPFLVASSGTSFLFTLISCGSLAEYDLDDAWEWLTSALEWTGSGAKTAVGYGRALLDAPSTASLVQEVVEARRGPTGEHQQPTKTLTADERWRERVTGLSEADVLELVRVNLERGELQDNEERHAFASAVFSEHRVMVEAWLKQRRLEPGTQTGGRKCRDRGRLLNSVLSGDRP